MLPLPCKPRRRPAAARSGRRAVFALRRRLVAVLLVALFVAVGIPAGQALSADLSLREGASGAEVLWLQHRLSALGLLKGTVTGYFGPNTAAAVREYQRCNGIAVSGVFGPVTAAHLCDAKGTHKIAPGENLTLIAQRSGVTVADIMAANPSIRSANRIYAGQTLVLPPPQRIAQLAGARGGTAAAGGGGATSGGSGGGAVPAAGTSLQPGQSGSQTAGQSGSPAPAKPPLNTSSGASGDEILHGPGPRVYLTFDCAGGSQADADSIRQTVAVLERAGVRAAFFVPYDRLDAFSAEIRLLGDRGHFVGPQVLAGTGAPAWRLLGAGLASASARLKDFGGMPAPWVRGPGAWVMDESFAVAAAAAGLRVLPWHNIGGLPHDTDSIDRLDRYLIEGAVIRLPLGTETCGYLEAWLARCTAAGVVFAGIDFLDGNPVGW